MRESAITIRVIRVIIIALFHGGGRVVGRCRVSYVTLLSIWYWLTVGQENKSKRKVQGVPQSQTAALPRHQEEEETDKSKQAQIDQMYEKY